MPSSSGSSSRAVRSEVEALASVRAILASPRVDVNRRSSKGLTLLHAASMRGHSTVIKELLTSGRFVDIESRYEGWTSLMLAARHHRSECVKLLVSHGAEVAEIFENKNIKVFLIHCLPFDSNARLAVIGAARAGIAEYHRRLRDLLMADDAPLVNLPVVLIDEIASYVSFLTI